MQEEGAALQGRSDSFPAISSIIERRPIASGILSAMWVVPVPLLLGLSIAGQAI